MKRFFSFLVITLFIIGLSGCEKKSEMEKAQDSISKAFQDTKDAVKDAAK